ncbi:hypothetical protein EVAR_28979_1 [Eumeta japonica]|uniref:Uncharacterized protein n=1 Tax=Eumeta variegata TaxID=151549 RepID=A0A4C1W2E2_EUMVA|nr:hypothetical protein EVAR_28979_1 [Eumeta japonica]
MIFCRSSRTIIKEHECHETIERKPESYSSSDEPAPARIRTVRFEGKINAWAAALYYGTAGAARPTFWRTRRKRLPSPCPLRVSPFNTATMATSSFRKSARD